MEKQRRINNDFYELLEEKWYTALDHPIALLRAENELRIPWVIGQIGKEKTVLDIGCGAGFLTNALAKEGHFVYGIDLSEKSLKIAAAHDVTKQVNYSLASGYSLPFSKGQFDVVTAMDLLEHVEEPNLVIKEASRVLKKGGLFFFHTFNRNLLSYLLIIKGVEWFVPNTPKDMHVYPLFIKPEELSDFCEESGLEIADIKGFVPKIFAKPFWKMVFTKKIPKNLSFTFSKSLKTGYCGYCIKI